LERYTAAIGLRLEMRLEPTEGSAQ
jgi:hypothetical protein